MPRALPGIIITNFIVTMHVHVYAFETTFLKSVEIAKLTLRYILINIHINSTMYFISRTFMITCASKSTIIHLINFLIFFSSLDMEC